MAVFLLRFLTVRANRIESGCISVSIHGARVTGPGVASALEFSDRPASWQGSVRSASHTSISIQRGLGRRRCGVGRIDACELRSSRDGARLRCDLSASSSRGRIGSLLRRARRSGLRDLFSERGSRYGPSTLPRGGVNGMASCRRRRDLPGRGRSPTVRGPVVGTRYEVRAHPELAGASLDALAMIPDAGRPT